MASIIRSRSENTHPVQRSEAAPHLITARRYYSESAINPVRQNTNQLSMRSWVSNTQRAIHKIGSLCPIFSQPHSDTLKLLAKRRRHVSANNDNLRGGPYNPKALTLSTFQGWLPAIRTNTEHADPSHLLEQLYHAMDSSDRLPEEKDWGAVKTILDACPTPILKKAIAQTWPRTLINIYSSIFCSLVETANTPRLPNRYSLSDQHMKHNHADWNDKTISLVKKLIDCLNTRAKAALSKHKSTTQCNASVLQQMLYQARYYSEKIEMPQPPGDDSTWISYDETASLIYYLNEKLNTL